MASPSELLPSSLSHAAPCAVSTLSAPDTLSSRTPSQAASVTGSCPSPVAAQGVGGPTVPAPTLAAGDVLASASPAGSQAADADAAALLSPPLSARSTSGKTLSAEESPAKATPPSTASAPAAPSTMSTAPASPSAAASPAAPAPAPAEGPSSSTQQPQAPVADAADAVDTIQPSVSRPQAAQPAPGEAVTDDTASTQAPVISEAVSEAVQALTPAPTAPTAGVVSLVAVAAAPTASPSPSPSSSSPSESPTDPAAPAATAPAPAPVSEEPASLISAAPAAPILPAAAPAACTGLPPRPPVRSRTPAPPSLTSSSSSSSAAAAAAAGGMAGTGAGAGASFPSPSGAPGAGDGTAALRLIDLVALQRRYPARTPRGQSSASAASASASASFSGSAGAGRSKPGTPTVTGAGQAPSLAGGGRAMSAVTEGSSSFPFPTVPSSPSTTVSTAGAAGEASAAGSSRRRRAGPSDGAGDDETAAVRRLKFPRSASANSVRGLSPALPALTSPGTAATAAGEAMHDGDVDSEAVAGSGGVVGPPECCERGECLAWYEQEVFPEDIRDSFHFGATLLTEFHPRYLRMRTNAGSVASGRVRVAVSTIAPSRPMLGLFATEAIPEGGVVTAYGGSRRPASALVAEPAAHRTHTRRVPGSLFVMDGRPHALLFARAKPDMSADALLPVPERASVAPLHSDADVVALVSEGGLGYMSNTGPKATHNVKIVTSETRRDGSLVPTLFLVATRPIEAHEEIISPYNNTDPTTGTAAKGQRKVPTTPATAADADAVPDAAAPTEDGQVDEGQETNGEGQADALASAKTPQKRRKSFVGSGQRRSLTPTRRRR